MFERYTETARRALFFSRYEASAMGTPTIEAEHLLLGVIRVAGPRLSQTLATGALTREDVRRNLEQRLPAGPTFSTSVEIPFSAEVIGILHYAVEEADAIKTALIEPEHLLAGLLRDEHSSVAHLLRSRGLTLRDVRDCLASAVIERTDGSLPDLEHHDGEVQRVTLMARAESALLRCPMVETADILSALLQVVPGDRLDPLFTTADAVAAMRRRLAAHSDLRERVVAESGSAGWSAEVIAAFVMASQEASVGGRRAIVPEHILLGLLAGRRAVAAAVLMDAGLSADAVRARLQAL